jgi:uncharacterized protein YaiE (UPF0345 family)
MSNPSSSSTVAGCRLGLHAASAMLGAMLLLGCAGEVTVYTQAANGPAAPEESPDGATSDPPSTSSEPGSPGHAPGGEDTGGAPEDDDTVTCKDLWSDAVAVTDACRKSLGSAPSRRWLVILGTELISCRSAHFDQDNAPFGGLSFELPEALQQVGVVAELGSAFGPASVEIVALARGAVTVALSDLPANQEQFNGSHEITICD